METTRSADGTSIAFDREGEGPALVLVVGAFCDRATSETLATLLAPQFTVFRYDRRGRGSSGDTAPYGVEREIEDLQAVAAAAGGPAFVFGHSSGAALALEAVIAGLPATRLVAYEPPYIVEGTRIRPAGLAERVSQLLGADEPSQAAELFLLEGPETPAEVVTMMKGAPLWSRFEALAHTLPYDLAILGDQHIPAEQLATLDVPTLVLSGAESPRWARDAVEAVAAAVPNSQHLVLEGQTHNAADDALAPVLTSFFLG
ncbi:MAG TPA: alpha/beta hydrolase [Acidimicrobiales bacterium]|jgi:pimeloyl-ACP methyl ester carboxylesterase|nr:alpha/beta hydrolase [Acidimicrobiales bacterium]